MGRSPDPVSAAGGGEPDRRTAVAAVVVVSAVLALLAGWVVVGSGQGAPPRGVDVPRGELAAPAAPAPATPLPGTPLSAATASGAAAAGGWAGVGWDRVVPLDCPGARVLVEEVVEGDVTLDGRVDAVVTARCDAGAGSPPEGVYAYAGPPPRPRLLSVLLEPSRQVLVERVEVVRGRLTVTGTGYSSADVPRCCPDLTVREVWRWTGTGLTREGDGPR